MKRRISYWLPIVLIGILSGCSLTDMEIRTHSQGEKKNVFSEVNEEGLPPKGFVDLLVKTSVKTHLEGYYFMESDETFHGEEEYPILINIDGQAVTWKLKGEKEIIPKEKGIKNPEKGEGMKVYA